MTNHELSLLLPRDPSLTNSDDWPIFELKGADIFDPDDPLRSPAVLLHAGSYRPLTITGKLGPLGEENAHLLHTRSCQRSQAIEITDVKEFSYGQYDNGNVDIWAAGRAGWYTIRPSRTYRAVYLHMLQSIRLLYFAGDTYKSVRKYADLSAGELFRRYHDAYFDTCDSPESAEAVFDDHRYFLLASMLSGKEGLDWARVPLFNHLETKFPDDTKIVRERLLFKPRKPASRKQSTQSPTPSTSSLKRKRPAPKERTVTPVEPKRPRSRMQSIATAASSVIASDDVGTEERSQRRGRPRRGSLQPGLSDTSSLQASDKMAKDSTSSDGESPAPLRRGRKGKSALRPKPSKYVQPKAPTPQETVAEVDKDEVDDDDDDENDDEAGIVTFPKQNYPPRRHVDGILRASGGLNRNKNIRLGDSGETTITSPDSDLDEGIDIPPDEDDASHDEGQGTNGVKEDLPFRIVTEDIEEKSDIWRCPQDGCMHRVYAASHHGSQVLIKEHQRTHDHDEDERVQLIRRMQAPWLPVGRLMGRVRELAEQRSMPAPIVQRY